MGGYHILAFILITTLADSAWTRKTSSASTTSDCDDKGCSHECETVGEFPLCVCPPDMTLHGDGRTCKENTSFLLAMFRGIRLYNEESEELTAIAPVRAQCLDYHYGRKELYAYTNYTVMRYPLSKGKTSSTVSMVARTDTAVTSLAVDWVNDVMYYISEQQLALGAMSLDGEDQRTVLTHNDSSTAGWRNLVVDPYAKKLFWIGSKGVYSCSLEGKDLETNLISWIEPDKIALDTRNQLIYVIGRHGDSRKKYIVRASYNGTRAGEDIETSQPAAVGIFGFGVVESTAYWESNHDGENLYKCDLEDAKSNKKVAATLVTEINQIVYDMKLYHKDIQKSRK